MVAEGKDTKATRVRKETKDSGHPISVGSGDLAREIALSGAWLFAVGLITGIWTAAALSGKVTVRIPHLALAAHLNALFGGLWLLVVASTVPYLGYERQRLRWLARWIALPSWANWFVTLVASFLGVDGLSYNESLPNNVIAAALQLLVVVPSFVGAYIWLRGFYVKGSPA